MVLRRCPRTAGAFRGYTFCAGGGKGAGFYKDKPPTHELSDEQVFAARDAEDAKRARDAIGLWGTAAPAPLRAGIPLEVGTHVRNTPNGRRVHAWSADRIPGGSAVAAAEADMAALDRKAPEPGGAFLFTHQRDWGYVYWYPEGVYAPGHKVTPSTRRRGRGGGSPGAPLRARC